MGRTNRKGGAARRSPAKRPTGRPASGGGFEPGAARPAAGRPPARKPGSRRPADKSRDQEAESAARTAAAAAALPLAQQARRKIELPDELAVRDLARALRTSPIEVIKALMTNGIVASINQVIDYDTAEIIARELGFETTLVQEEMAPGEERPEEKKFESQWKQLAKSARPEQLKPRPPVVTVLGHVDHGKTTLLDAIRRTRVVDAESGGITQHIGAYQVEKGGRKITFLDTPGHEAFTAMRARGAQVTDLAVLVVAADDGVMPQTREAIGHARAAGVPILVALNKIDKPGVNPERVKQQLAEVGLTVEDWGGDVICVPVSAKMNRGIDELLENILLVTDVADLRANPDRRAGGTVIEGQLDKQRGPTATLLVQGGVLRPGDALSIGVISGRVRAMLNDRGEPIDAAPPSMPVLVMGLSDVPKAGDIFEVVGSEREARVMAEQRLEAQRLAQGRPVRPKLVSLDDVFRRFEAGEVMELNLVFKADVQGSVEPIVNSLTKLGNEDLKVRILYQGIGRISESDVMLAAASGASVVGFHVDVDEAARRLAAQEGVDVRQYDIIYQLIDDLDKALKGLLEPVYQDAVIGHAEIRAVFFIKRRGNVAGCLVTDGEITRNAKVKVLRAGQVIFEGQVDSLRRFQEDVPEAKTGFECGIGIAGYEGYQPGDILEAYKKVRVS
jgi:translation initiation factor IF-2